MAGAINTVRQHLSTDRRTFCCCTSLEHTVGRLCQSTLSPQETTNATLQIRAKLLLFLGVPGLILSALGKSACKSYDMKCFIQVNLNDIFYNFFQTSKKRMVVK